ncbi:MAG TPA: gamma-glutamylcyclotransferase family protein [Pyrinomonadaceae bacterium]|nr:gamma-glutamylcyclotransferase family protein [Pyrinomonadaceae bacterium]
MSDYIFIYGTLAPDIAPTEIAPAVSKLKFIGRGYVYGKLYDLGEYPGAKLSRRVRSKVRGRVYRLPTNKQVIKSLDAYEEFRPDNPEKSLYLRKRAPVTLDNGKTLETWIYEYNGDVSFSPVVRGGDYSKVLAELG